MIYLDDNNTMFCKLKSIINIIESQEIPSFLYLEYLDKLWQLLVLLTFWARKNFTVYFGLWWITEISLYPFLIFFAIDYEIFFQDTDCKKRVLSVIIKYLKLKLQNWIC